jgi:hypothetical protein
MVAVLALSGDQGAEYLRPLSTEAVLVDLITLEEVKLGAPQLLDGVVDDASQQDDARADT